MNFKYVLITFAMLFTASISQAQSAFPDSLSVDRVIQMVIANHPAIKQASQQEIVSKARVSIGESAYYPNIIGQGLYARIAPVPNLALPTGEVFDLYPTNNYDFHLALQQTIYDFGRRPTAVKLARSIEKSAGDNVDLTKSNLAYQTVETFYLILLLQKNIQVLDEEIAALNQHILSIQKKVKAGTATDFDVLTTQVRVAEAQNQKIDVINALNKQRDQLEALTGLPSGQALEIKGEFEMALIDINPDSLISMAFNQLPQVRLSYDAEAMAEFQYQLASKGYWPELNMNLEFGFKNGYTPDLNKLEANWIAGVELQVPIFNGFSTKYNIVAAYSNLSAAKEGTQNVRRQIATDVQQAIADYRAGQEKVQTSKVLVEQAQAAVSISQTRYDVGVITNLDLLDAQTSLAYAKLVYLQALYGVVSSQYALDRAIGNRIWE